MLAGVSDTPPAQPDDELWRVVRQRLIDEGLSPERSGHLATSVAEAIAHVHDVRHPIRSAEHEVEHLEEIAQKGESPATPAILAGGLLAILIPIVAILIGAAFLIPYLVTRGSSGETASAVPWALPNGDLLNTRVAHGTPISADTVANLGVAWTMP